LILEFLAAVSFLTRLPVERRFHFGPKEVARSARWFPLVGLLMGALSMGSWYALSLIFSPLVTAVLLVALGAILTGALHLDGLADTADGFGGGRTREDVLRIMRDHAIGSYGAAALILDVVLKAAAIAALVDRRRALEGLLLAPVLGRWSAVLLSATQPYARNVEDDRVTAGTPTRLVARPELTIATIVAIAIAVAVNSLVGGAALICVALAAGGWAWWCRCRIGGITGDTLGAAVEAAECLVLLMFVAIH
jgi:cobalamin 5'-phosphate synthase/cobalamin synthase